MAGRYLMVPLGRVSSGFADGMFFCLALGWNRTLSERRVSGRQLANQLAMRESTWPGSKMNHLLWSVQLPEKWWHGMLVKALLVLSSGPGGRTMGGDGLS